jgi:hypothetical protein
MKLSIVTMTDYEWYAMDGVRQFGGKAGLARLHDDVARGGHLIPPHRHGQNSGNIAVSR